MLISGIGYKIATAPLSSSYLIQYLLFIVLLMMLAIDHRLYLIIPDSFAKSLDADKEIIKPLSLPSFASTKPEPVSYMQRGSTVSSGIYQSLLDAGKQLSEMFGLKSPQAAADVQSKKPSLSEMPPRKFSQKSHQFKHPMEGKADYIKTTKKILSEMGQFKDHLNHLDNNISKTRLSDKSDVDLMGSGYIPDSRMGSLDQLQYQEILSSFQEGAVIISRGIVKAANHSFSDIIKRPVNDIVNHNFMDFVAPEGISSFKSHCTNRLAGNSSTVYPIVLQSKKLDKINKDVVIKKINLKGIQVEISVFKTPAN